MWLQDMDFVSNGLLVQIKLGYEEYNGRQRIKVLFVDAENAAHEIQKADDNMRRSLSNRLGSKLRALAGGTPAPAPKPTAPPRAPAPVSKALPHAAKPIPAELAAPSTMNDAWARFTQACPMTFTNEQVKAEWFRIIGELFPGKEIKLLTPDEWGVMRDRGVPMIRAVAGDDIPF